MKMIVSNLPEYMAENQDILANLLLLTMNANNFNVNGIHINFIAEPVKEPK